MAHGNFVLDKGFDAAAALTKFRAVKLTTTGTATPVTAITDRPVGVEQFGVATGEITKGKGASVRVLGITEIEVAGVINPGDVCQLETDGRVTALVGASGKRIVGLHVGTVASTGAGDRIPMLIIHGAAVA